MHTSTTDGHLTLLSPRRRQALLAVLAGLAIALGSAQSGLAIAPPAFTSEVRLGFPGGDDWEPAIAADSLGHVYVLWTHYVDYAGLGAGDVDPTCPDCGSPHMDLQISGDNGATFGEPFAPWPTSTRQDDPQIVVDPVDGTTVFAAFMEGNKSSEYVAKSTDFGRHWQKVLVEPLQRGTDKDILAVRGDDIYLVYHTKQKIYASISHDAGDTWVTRNMIGNTSEFGETLASGGAIDSEGNAYFAWNGVHNPGQAKGRITLYVTSSTDGGQTWTVSTVDVSQAAPPCGCYGWDYWGAQMALDVDDADNVYVLWNANRVKYGPQRMFFAQSIDGAASWSDAIEVSAAAPGANHAFPALVAGAAGDVRVAWTDDRNGHDNGSSDPDARWNVYYRSSTDGGVTWSDEAKLSSFVPGFEYKLSAPLDGFLQPYGDYFEIDINALEKTVAIWGEGNSYIGPGNIWYARQP
jgi:hypothetical protein